MNRHDTNLEANPPQSLTRISAGETVTLRLAVSDPTDGPLSPPTITWKLYKENSTLNDLQAQGVFTDGISIIPSEITHGLFGAFVLSIEITFDNDEKQIANYFVQVKN